GKTDLIKHSQGVKHFENINFKKSVDNDNNKSEKLSQKDKVKQFEIKLAAFYAEHNVAFYTVDFNEIGESHKVPLLKDICMDPKVVQDFTLGRLKCTNIVKDIIAKREIEKVVDKLQSSRFSILIDESIDISDSKLIKLFEIFKNLKIPLKNISACDNASVMIGCNNSFMQRLKLEIPRLVTLNCICHSSAIVASKACEKLPSSCENLIRSISSYISGSAKRCVILREFQEFFKVERNKLLKRILENWNVLQNYFVLAVIEDKLKSAEIILSHLNDDIIKAYFLFLKYVLNFFNSFNALFQSRKILVHQLFESSQQLIRQLGRNFMTVNSLKCINNLNVDNEQNILNLENIHVGFECENLLKLLPLECRQQIKLACLDFYKTAVQEMLKRLPYKDPLFEHLTFLNPKIALYYDENRIKIKDLSHVAVIVENIDITQLDFEWRILPSIFDDEQTKELASLEIDEMWGKILAHKDFNDEIMFPNLQLLVEAVLSLPHSNAEAERIFSIVTDAKNKKRNRLSNDTVSTICVTRSSFQAEGINCTNFEIDPRYLELHNSQNLYGNKNISDEA
ncbi:hypothetical protein ALC57_17824, partial [Trachymyrmex cornetzi]